MFARSRRRLAAWFTLSMGSILILFAITIYQRQATEQKREFDEAIYARAKKIAEKTEFELNQNRQLGVEKIALLKELNSGGSSNLICWLRRELSVSRDPPEFLPPLLFDLIADGSNLICTRWYDTKKRLLVSIGSCPQFSFSTTKWRTIKYDRYNDRPALRVVTLPLSKAKFPVGYVQVTASMTNLENFQGRSRLFAIGIPITLIVTAIVGWLLAGLAMRPIKRSYEQLQRFTADASHELRAPISAILSNAVVGLLASADDTTQPRQRLEKIVTQSKYMSGLITNLLFLARHQGQLNPQDVNTTDIVKLLNSLAERYQTLATKKGLKFELDLPVVVKQISCDRDLLQQAIGNLLDNAIKYTSAGGVVTLKLEIKPRRIFITVLDTGVGIPKADLIHIFDRFYRVDKARTRQTGGFGLGLAIAQQIVLAHNGKIAVESEIGTGTTFQVCLPINLVVR